MTNPGLYADLHQEMREIADLVDNVIAQLRQDYAKQSVERVNLARRLELLTDSDPDDLADRLLSIALGVNQDNNRRQWQTLCDVLSSIESDASIIEKLETFAYLLEQRQADTLAKMRGWMK